MKKLLLALALTPLFVTSMSGNALAIDQEGAKALYAEKFSSWINNDKVISAIKSQNAKHADLTQDDINALDQKWRNDDASVIDPVLNSDLSTYIQSVIEGGEGLYAEIFVMDKHGLNVGQGAKTSDYWQGDEAKFTESYGNGVDAIHISDVEFDESSQTYLVQLSFTISDGGAPIGAVTVGVDAEMIE